MSSSRLGYTLLWGRFGMGGRFDAQQTASAAKAKHWDDDPSARAGVMSPCYALLAREQQHLLLPGQKLLTTPLHVAPRRAQSSTGQGAVPATHRRRAQFSASLLRDQRMSTAAGPVPAAPVFFFARFSSPHLRRISRSRILPNEVLVCSHTRIILKCVAV